ncbi:MAG: 2Fe-2S iron-sulfur cluster binding domain-containing protein [Phycisphaerae bacterium]|nr:2Fe-2S iron-sulfur cluster binding domain-containing protein [Phycisphaerae bacterium]
MDYDYVWAILAFTGLVVLLAAWLLISEKLLVNYGQCKVDINGGEEPLVVQGGQSLLSCLYSNKIFIPSACGGKGTCGFCKVTVEAGGGPVLPTEMSYLSRKEVRSNVRLACQVKIREDVSIRIPADLLDVKMFEATVISNVALTSDINEITMKLNEPTEISQREGQYVQVQASSPDGEVFRAYSISSAVYEKNIVELIVRQIPNGIASTYLCEIEAGAKVNFTGPYGEFMLNQDPEVEIVCVAGGSGMAPCKNIIYSVYDKWPDRTIWFFFGCRTTKDVFYMDEFNKLAEKFPNLHIVYALSDELTAEEKSSWTGETGYVHLAVDKFIKGDVQRQAFLCGPPLMIDAVTKVLIEKGVKPEDVFYDEF